MINHVRNTVLTILNKENRGFITPSQFDSYAKHAQQLLFNQYVSEYSRMLAAKNARRISSEFMNRKKQIRKNIEKFTKTANVSMLVNKYDKPSDMLHLLSVRYGNFEVEQVSREKESYLLNSNITAPSSTYPIHTDNGESIKLYPSTLTEDVTFTYVRHLKDPKWTYTTVAENPIYNPTAADHQDFELSEDESVNLIVEILKLTGLTIREAEVTQAASGIDQQNTSKDS
jgi:hypothetical protein